MVVASCEAAELGTSSVTTREELRTKAGDLVAEASAVVVALDPATEHSRPLTEARARPAPSVEGSCGTMNACRITTAGLSASAPAAARWSTATGPAARLRGLQGGRASGPGARRAGVLGRGLRHGPERLQPDGPLLAPRGADLQLTFSRESADGIPLELSFQERSRVAPDSSRLPDLGGPQTADGSPRPRFHAHPPYALRVGQIAIRGGRRMKRILLAVDGSDHSQRATAVAEDLKPKMGGVELIVFHAHEEGIGSPMEVPQAGRPPCEWHCGGAHQGWCECAAAKPRGHTVGGLHRRSIQAAKRQTTSI